MIEVEGYKAFKGILQVTPKIDSFQPLILIGSFLYKPDTKCWYHKGSSYPENICVILKDETL